MSGGHGRGIIPVREVKGRSGRSFLVQEETDRLALDRYDREMANMANGLVLSTAHPSKLEGRIASGKVLWVSRSKGGLNPSRLDYDIYQEVSRFYKDVEGGGIVLILGIEYLSMVNGFKLLARFLKKIGDRASSSDGALIVGMNPLAFDEKEVAMLDKMFDHIERGGAGVRVVEAIVPGKELPGWSYLLLDKRAYRGLQGFDEKGVCVTTVQPEKVRRWEDFKGKVIWVSESESKEALHPSKLRYEIQQGVLRGIDGGSRQVYIDGLEHLVLYTGLDEVIGFVKSVSDSCSQAGAFLVASLDQKAVERKEFALFKRMFDKVVG
jgi:hypothetical protein